MEWMIRAEQTKGKIDITYFEERLTGIPPICLLLSMELGSSHEVLSNAKIPFWCEFPFLTIDVKSLVAWSSISISYTTDFCVVFLTNPSDRVYSSWDWQHEFIHIPSWTTKKIWEKRFISPMGMIPRLLSPPLPNDEPDERINGLTCEQCINGMTRADQGIKAIATRIKVIPTPSEPDRTEWIIPYLTVAYHTELNRAEPREAYDIPYF
jgi:hypothetical protein